MPRAASTSFAGVPFGIVLGTSCVNRLLAWTWGVAGVWARTRHRTAWRRCGWTRRRPRARGQPGEQSTVAMSVSWLMLLEDGSGSSNLPYKQAVDGLGSGSMQRGQEMIPAELI